MMNWFDRVRYWGPYSTVGWGLFVCAAFFFAQLASFLGYIGFFSVQMSEDEISSAFRAIEHDAVFVSLATIASAFICSLLLFAIMRLKRGASATDYSGLRLPPWDVTLRWLFYLAIFIIATDILIIVFDAPIVSEFEDRIYESATTFYSQLMLSAALILFAPFFEELFFRGFLIPGLLGTRLGVGGSVVITAVCWAMLHSQYELHGVLLIFMFGVLLGLARVLTGSTLLPILMHSINNLISLLESLFLK